MVIQLLHKYFFIIVFCIGWCFFFFFFFFYNIRQMMHLSTMLAEQVDHARPGLEALSLSQKTINSILVYMETMLTLRSYVKSVKL
ncbi:hypothetical protein MKW92_011108 [Papaver armeniacum]|nr:hypothetical protein MKW92_011108 [Papaver armeniacum]